MLGQRFKGPLEPVKVAGFSASDLRGPAMGITQIAVGTGNTVNRAKLQ